MFYKTPGKLNMAHMVDVTDNLNISDKNFQTTEKLHSYCTFLDIGIRITYHS